MLNKTIPTDTQRILLLVATGYREDSTVFCLAHLREACLPVALVSLSYGLVKGKHGLTIKPDHTLEEVIDGETPALIILADGCQNNYALMADPRVHRLIEKTWAQNGRVVSLGKQRTFQTKNGNNRRIIQQEGDLPTFIERLAERGEGVRPKKRVAVM